MEDKILPECVRRFDNIDTKLSSIEKLLLGNGQVGIGEMARRAFDHCQQMKASKNGLWDWAFRVVIMTVIGFIAVQVGLK